MLRQLLAVLALAFLTVNAHAAEWIVPAASHAPGASNTNWRTDLRIVNSGSTAADVRVDLLPQGTDNAARPANVTVSVPAAGQLSLVDVLAAKFGFTGNAALLISSSNPSLIVTSRTYNQAANGSTYGQFIPGVPTSEAISGTKRGDLIYLMKNADYRTNVGFAGTTATAGKVTVSMFDASGTAIGTGTFDVQPYGQSQVNDIFGATGAPASGVARAELSSTVPVVAYASVIDNRTGDPFAMIGGRDAGATDLAIPAVAHAAGAASSLWRSDLRIFNPADRALPVTLTYYAANNANASPATRTMSIGGRQLLALDDVVLSTFGIDNGTGAVRIRADQNLLATSRTYNQSPTGTFGQDIPAISTAGALAANATSVYSGLSDSGYRTNVGFFNLTASAIDLTLTLKGADGAAIASKPFHLDGNTMTQLNVFSFLGAAGVPIASLTISGSGTGSYLAYASVVDNASGDPVYVPAAIGAPADQQQPPANGDCVSLPLLRAGLKASYNVTGALNYTTETTVVSDSPTETVQQQHHVVNGTPEEVDSTFTYTVQGDLRALTHAVSVAKTNAGGFAITVTTDSTFTVPMVLAPVSSFCGGREFAIPATVQTVVVGGTFPGPTTTYNRPAKTGTILATNESLTVAAGTFRTVKYRGVYGNTDPKSQQSLIWLDVSTGALVKEQDFDANGNVFAMFELTSLQ